MLQEGVGGKSRTRWKRSGRAQINDSSAIISRLSAEIAAQRQQQQQQAQQKGGGGKKKQGGFLSSLFGGGEEEAAAAKPCCCAAKKREEDEKWRRWVDDWFVKVGRGASAGGRAAGQAGDGALAVTGALGLCCIVECSFTPSLLALIWAA